MHFVRKEIYICVDLDEITHKVYKRKSSELVVLDQSSIYLMFINYCMRLC